MSGEAWMQRFVTETGTTAVVMAAEAQSIIGDTTVHCPLTVPALHHGREAAFENGNRAFAAGKGTRKAPGMPGSSVTGFAP